MIINGVLDRTPPTIHRLPIEVKKSEAGVPRVGDRPELAVRPGTLGWSWLAEPPRLLPASPLSRP